MAMDSKERLCRLKSQKLGASNGTATYTYDGDGRRVTKTAGGVTTTYVYDAKGDLASEYSTQPPPPPCLTCYVTTDHLGSTRVVTDENAVVTARHDFLPFGEELTTSNRTAALGYGAYDNVMHKYTGQERDLEGPGLDFFHARYFHDAQGRFTSPDPILSSGRVMAPQTWDRYAYGLNNPLRVVDPTGLYVWDNSAGGSMTDEQLQSVAADKDDPGHKAAQGALDFRERFRDALASAAGAEGSPALSDTQRSALQMALGAYGSEGENNGVTVGAQSGHGGGTKLQDNDTISVKIGASLNGGFLAATVAHEGAHVDQDTFWLKGGESCVGNINHYASEQAAWAIGASVAQALGMKNFHPYGVGGDYDVWNRGWRAADVDALRSRGISRIVEGLMHLKPSGSDTMSNEHHHTDGQ